MKFFKRILVLSILGLPLIAWGFAEDSPSQINTLPGGGDYLPVAEVMPAPVGGMNAIRKKITYPDFARKAGIQGNVYVLAFISEGGDVDNVKLVKGIGGGCDDEVIDAVKSSKFTPGTNKGTPVKVKLSLAFSFKK